MSAQGVGYKFPDVLARVERVELEEPRQGKYVAESILDGRASQTPTVLSIKAADRLEDLGRCIADPVSCRWNRQEVLLAGYIGLTFIEDETEPRISAEQVRGGVPCPRDSLVGGQNHRGLFQLHAESVSGWAMIDAHFHAVRLEMPLLVSSASSSSLLHQP